LMWRGRTGEWPGLTALFSGSAAPSRCTDGEVGGLRNLIGTAVVESRRALTCGGGRLVSGDRRGELGLDKGRGGSSSGNASNCQGCRPVSRVNNARLSSKDSSGGVLGRSILPGVVRNLCLSSSVGRGNSGRSPGMLPLPSWA
jgi:hypothetical protein